MNNKKRKVETSTSVSDLVKPKESKIETSTSVSDLIKSKKSKIETSTSVSDLIKSNKSKTFTSTSVSDLIKSNKSKIEIKSKETKMANLIKPKKKYLYLYYCKRCNDVKIDFHSYFHIQKVKKNKK